MNYCQHFNMAIKRMTKHLGTPGQYEINFTLSVVGCVNFMYESLSDYEFTVDWDDGTIVQKSGTAAVSQSVWHNYSATGNYTIKIFSNRIETIALYGNVLTKYPDRGSPCLYATAGGVLSVSSVTIPNGVTEIAHGACIKLTGLTSMQLPNSIENTGILSFYGCTGLTTITISRGNISRQSFQNCTGLSSVTIQNGVSSIGLGAFLNCTGISSVTIPSSVTAIYKDAFGNCTGLTTICFNNPTPPSTFISTAFDGVNSTGLVYVPVGAALDYSTALSGTGLSGWTIVEQQDM